MQITHERPAWMIRLAQLVLVSVLLTCWELMAYGDRKVQFFFSRPSRIMVRMWDWLHISQVYINTWETLTETILGFVIGVAGGLLLALACFYIPMLYQVIQPFMEIANGMPRAVLGPLFILWFGLGLTSKAALAASLVIFIVFFATLSGLREVDQHIVHKVRLMGGSHRDMLLHVLLPSALSWVFSSLRSSVGFALAGAVIGEYIGSSRGLGYQISHAEGNLDATGIFAGLLVLALIVLVLNALLGRVERTLTPWRAT